jgi:phosphoglycolate phosphatase
MMNPTYQAVLFDLDGTLCDTALDFTLALNRLLTEEKRPTLSLTHIRNEVSNGALAIIQMAFPDIEHEGIQLSLRNRMVAFYKEHITWHTRLYPGMDKVLAELNARHIPWGVVTNKPEGLTRQIMNGLSLSAFLPSSIVGGDTLAYAKPRPEPLLLAAEQCGVTAKGCIYIGDHRRDIEAAHAAGMASVAVSFGYLSPDDNAHHWGADAVVDSPYQLATYLGLPT